MIRIAFAGRLRSAGYLIGKRLENDANTWQMEVLCSSVVASKEEQAP